MVQNFVDLIGINRRYRLDRYADQIINVDAEVGNGRIAGRHSNIVRAFFVVGRFIKDGGGQRTERRFRERSVIRFMGRRWENKFRRN